MPRGSILTNMEMRRAESSRPTKTKTGNQALISMVKASPRLDKAGRRDIMNAEKGAADRRLAPGVTYEVTAELEAGAVTSFLLFCRSG